MSHLWRRTFSVVCLMTAVTSCEFLAPPQVWAGEPTDQVKASVDQVLQTLQDPRLKSEGMTAQRNAAIRRAAESIFDFTETGRRALGRHWQSLNEAQRKEFVSLFTDLLERSYTSRMEKYTGEKIVYTGDTIEGDLASVKTRLISQKGQELPIDYRLHRRGGRWLIYDVNVEGVSLVSNYRTQFDKILQTASFDDLVAKMKTKQMDSTPPGGAPSSGGRSPSS